MAGVKTYLRLALADLLLDSVQLLLFGELRVHASGVRIYLLFQPKQDADRLDLIKTILAVVLEAREVLHTCVKEGEQALNSRAGRQLRHVSKDRHAMSMVWLTAEKEPSTEDRPISLCGEPSAEDSAHSWANTSSFCDSSRHKPWTSPEA